MNRKAMLLSKTLTIIIGVICIGFLLILLYKLGNFSQERVQEEQAKSTLNGIEGVVNSLVEGGQGDYIVLNPKDWYLFNFKEANNNIPSECKKKNCLCV